MQLIQQYDLKMDELFVDSKVGPDPFMMIRQVMNREKFSKWLLGAALKINGAMNKERDNTTRQSMERAKQYIHGELSGSGPVGGADLPHAAYEPCLFFYDV